MQPTKERNHVSFLLRYNEENILFDCGEGTQRQLRISGLKPAKITKLLISHWHGDHVFGIPGLLSSMGADQYSKKLHIYGPKGSQKYLDHLLKSFATQTMVEFEMHEVESGVVFDCEEYFIEAQPLKHSSPCVGFSLVEKDRLRINTAKAARLGVPEGPLLGKLQKGEDISFKNRKVKSSEVTYQVKGKKISYIADTLPCDGADYLAKDADLLVSEGTHLSDIAEKTEKYMHLTVKDAALIASQNNAKKLIITHVSPRYKSIAEVVDEARTYFDNTVVAEDFLRVKI
jgi:ribonuclease Z